MRLISKKQQRERAATDAAGLAMLGPVEGFPGDNCCRFIPGDVAQPGWQCCGRPNVPGRSWCQTHLHVVYDHVRTEAYNQRRRTGDTEQSIDRRQFNSFGRKHHGIARTLDDGNQAATV